MTNLGQYDLLPATQAAVERMYARDDRQILGGGGGQTYNVLDVLDEYFRGKEVSEEQDT